MNKIADDKATISSACEQFLELRERLPQHAISEINRVLESFPIDPRTASPDEAWRVMWDKPLYAYAYTTTGEKWVNKLEPFMQGAWSVWGADPAAFRIIRKADAGPKKDAGAFLIEGRDAQNVIEITGIAVHRLFAIQNSAALLREMAAQSETPADQFWKEPLSSLVPDLVRRLGWGWGDVTVLHMLTDFGVACKPDRHIMRTLRHLGIWNCDSDQPDSKGALAVNRVIKLMVEQSGEVTPARLRRMDIELMALSKNKVITS